MATISLLSPERVTDLVSGVGLLLDLRPFDRYLKSHQLGSISLMFEAGPGFAGRARDLLPLDARLILLDHGESPLDVAAAMLRGKGLEVTGYSDVSEWPQRTSTRDVMLGEQGTTRLVDVGDPGTLAPPSPAEYKFISVETLWRRDVDLDTVDVGVLAGWGVRAATAIGILEKRGVEKLVFVRTRPRGSRPATTEGDVTIFRLGGQS